eukprot:TRINITY_DN6816_c0_g1_i1.p1 TRINITY_DN6816_c0_g1~~TRINITY_DN6816_c0_g1_i1.p1  ORF type:complete len:333 (-),score=50.78 TRINITY_DN6816_c0_g1_i1:503-1444(-)
MVVGIRASLAKLPSVLNSIKKLVASWTCFLSVDALQSLFPDATTLLDVVVPAAALGAFLVSAVVLLRSVAWRLERSCRPERTPRFGRKGLVVSAACLLFVASCLYRAIFVADEGASLCRGRPSVFNAPVSGRLVATVGEIALVVQLSSYLDDTARRLDVMRGLWAASKRFTYAPVVLAECLSWCGVLSGVPQFFCCEYVVWMFIAATWVWDSAELLTKSVRRGDVLSHASLLLGGMGLFLFNACHEMPHFFLHQAATAFSQGNAFSCHQDMFSPIWEKRLLFFVTYFFGCSWCSAAVSMRYLLRGSGKEGKSM